LKVEYTGQQWPVFFCLVFYYWIINPGLSIVWTL
jgi:hypothetical protein